MMRVPASVIIHIDMDCFYCQVEQRRLNIPAETPVAVQQWEGLIAVNYPARAAGVRRHMRVAEARTLCPSLVLVHVETIGDSTVEDTMASRDRHKVKVSLERYRRASREWYQVLRDLFPGSPIEKASIDEAYVDITARVDTDLKRFPTSRRLHFRLQGRAPSTALG